VNPLPLVLFVRMPLAYYTAIAAGSRADDFSSIMATTIVSLRHFLWPRKGAASILSMPSPGCVAKG